MPIPLTEQVIVISGAARGIGAATAQLLVDRGARVVLIDRDGSTLTETTQALGYRATAITVDVTDPQSCASAITQTLQQHGRIDAVWANAGISAYGPMELLDPHLWRRVVEVNLIGTYNLVHAALPELLHTRGYVAITASWASFAHSPGHTAYTAAKAGVEALANSLRSELAHQHVRVGVFHPGWVDTPMVADKHDHQPAFRAFLASLPRPLRAITPVHDVAAVFADAFEDRPDRVVHPTTGWILHMLRPLLPTRLFTARARAIAPTVRQLFAEQQAEGKMVEHSATSPGCAPRDQIHRR